MLIFKKYKKQKKNLKFIIIIFQIINLFLITSCTLKDFKKNNTILFSERKNQFKTLIIPKGVTVPNKNKEYNIPYRKKDLVKENYNIFPPI